MNFAESALRQTSGVILAFLTLGLQLLFPFVGETMSGRPARTATTLPVHQVSMSPVPGQIRWTARASLPTPRIELGVAAATNGKIYAIGGYGLSAGVTSIVEEYDPATNSWATRASMPTRRNVLGALGAPNGKVYAIGGYGTGGDKSTVEEYDPTTNTWTTRARMPTGRYGLAVVSAEGANIFAVGGCCDGNGLPLSALEEYDPDTNTWVTRAAMPTPRQDLAAAQGSNGKLYAMGGRVNNTILGTLEEYDPATNSWTRLPDMPYAQFSLGAAAKGRFIYAIGGARADHFPQSPVQVYDIVQKTWMYIPPKPIFQFQFGLAKLDDNRLYAIGGQAASHPDNLHDEGSLLQYQALLPGIHTNYKEPYRDDFGSSSSGWPITDDGISSRGYVDGRYRILIKQSDYIVRAGNNLLARDFRAEVDALSASHTDGSVGMYFGSGNAGFYLFDVAYGQFRVLRHNLAARTWTVLIGPRSHTAIRPGNEANRLKVTRSGSTITLHANGQQLGQVVDGTFGDGYAGLVASAFANDFDARFDNFLMVFNSTGTTTQGIAAFGAETRPRVNSGGIEVVPSPESGPQGWK